MKVLIIILMFFVISILLIINSNNLAMYKQENIEKFSGLFLKWMDKICINAQTLIGKTVRLDWLP